MSLKDDNRIHTRKVVDLKDKCKLFISNEILDKIKVLHDTVTKDTEWSAILVYESVTGDATEPETWEIKVIDVIPMDIGNATYTEYEIDASDSYAADIWMDALDKGYKIGHLHTHHSMGCFFSGTDMSELHDNAPKHAYYLSLIVNYRTPSNWVAKVAICGNEIKEGIKKVEGSVKTVISWTATEDTFETVKDLTEETPIVSVQDLLYTIDCDIIVDSKEISVPEAFVERIKELQKPKKYVPAAYGYQRKSIAALAGRGIEKDESLKRNAHNTGGVQTEMWLGDDFPYEGHIGSLMNEEDMLSDVEDSHESNRDKEFFKPAKVASFLAKWLQQDAEYDGQLSQVIALMCQISETNFTKRLNRMDDTFEMYASKYFDIKLDAVDMVCIAYSCKDLLQNYKGLTRIYNEVNRLLNGFLLCSDEINPKIITHLTGLTDIKPIKIFN